MKMKEDTAEDEGRKQRGDPEADQQRHKSKDVVASSNDNDSGTGKPESGSHHQRSWRQTDNDTTSATSTSRNNTTENGPNNDDIDSSPVRTPLALPLPSALQRNRRLSNSLPGAFSVDAPLEHTTNENLTINSTDEEMGLGSVQQPSHSEEYLVEATLVQETADTSSGANNRSEQDQTNDDVVEAKILQGVVINRRRLLVLLIAGFCILCAAIATVVVVTRRSTSNNKSTEPTTTSTQTQDTNKTSTQIPARTTLQRVQDERVLRCGVAQKGIADTFHDSPEIEHSNEAAFCRAIAAAAIGDDFRVEYITHSETERFEVIGTGKADVLFNYLSHTMDRDIYVPEIEAGLSFVSPYWYSITHYGGWSKYVECVLQDISERTDCVDLSVCAIDGTRHADILAVALPKNQVKAMPTRDDIVAAFVTGECNAMVAGQGAIFDVKAGVEEAGWSVEDFVMDGVFSLEPIACAVRESDVEWRDFVFWVFQALLAADAFSISSTRNTSIESTAAEASLQVSFPQTNVFGEQTQDMLYNAVREAGSLGHVWDLFDETLLPRNRFSFGNNGSTGIIHALPFGATNTAGPKPSPNSTLTTITQRGHLICGARLGRPGFAQMHFDNVTKKDAWTGIDVDYCRALTAAIFPFNDGETLELVDIADDAEGFQSLHKGSVDVYSGVMLTMERDVQEPSVENGFSFTRPYFYNVSAIMANEPPSNTDLNLCMATREDDIQWSKFVMWVVEATFFAEEYGVTKLSSNDMPVVQLFGPGYERMFRDAIFTVGSYADIYERNVEQYVPRNGLNLLYDKANPGPLLFVYPGVVNF